MPLILFGGILSLIVNKCPKNVASITQSGKIILENDLLEIKKGGLIEVGFLDLPHKEEHDQGDDKVVQQCSNKVS